MSRINTNVNSLISQRILTQNSNNLTKSLERLSTGFRINRGGDDPAGLIVSEKLRSELTKIKGAIGNAQRAEQIINIAEGGITEISGLLIELQGLVNKTANAAGTSTEEKEANQVQVDNILQTIDRISSTTNFQGVKLLNGGYDFRVSVGSTDTTVSDFKIHAAKFDDGSTQAVNISTTASAQHGVLFLSTGAAAHINGTGSVTLEIAGAKGTKEFTFASAETLANIAAQINSFTSVTGVSATVSAGVGVTLKTDSFGSDQFVSVEVVNAGGSTSSIKAADATDEDDATDANGTDHGALTAINEAIRDAGQDLAGSINGVTARGKGTTISINTDSLAADITLTTAGATANGGTAVEAFVINGGGASFNLGPAVDATNRVQVGIQNVASRKLGLAANKLDTLRSGGTQNLVDGDLTTAQTVVDKAIDQIALLRGRLGALQNLTVGTTIRSLNIALENTSLAESIIRDTDFAEVTAELTRNQILVQAASSALQISNANPQNVLALF